MDEHAIFGQVLDRAERQNAHPVAAVGGDGQNELYASLMSKEHDVLELIRRVDDTKRESALRASDKVAPVIKAFVANAGKFVARLVHYASIGAYSQVIGLLSTPDGMVYAGVAIALLSLIAAVL